MLQATGSSPQHSIAIAVQSTRPNKARDEYQAACEWAFDIAQDAPHTKTNKRVTVFLHAKKTRQAKAILHIAGKKATVVAGGIELEINGVVHGTGAKNAYAKALVDFLQEAGWNITLKKSDRRK